MTSPHVLPHTQYLDLLDRHGRAGLHALGELRPNAPVPPDSQTALGYAQDHLATLEVWAWLLAHPESGWRDYDAGPSPVAYDDVLAAIDRARDHLTRLLVDVGPDLGLDYFDRPGTSHDVARLLAHEAINVAFAAGVAGGLPAPALHPDVASDCLDRALAHWSEPDADVRWHPAHAHLVAADTGRSWRVRFGDESAGRGGAIALAVAGSDLEGPASEGEPGRTAAPSPVSEGPVALTLTDASDRLLRWLEGHPVAPPRVEGDDTTLRMLRTALGHVVEPEPRRPWWRRR